MLFAMQRYAVEKRTILVVLALLSLRTCMSQGPPEPECRMQQQGFISWSAAATDGRIRLVVITSSISQALSYNDISCYHTTESPSGCQNIPGSNLDVGEGFVSWSCLPQGGSSFETCTGTSGGDPLGSGCSSVGWSGSVTAVCQGGVWVLSSTGGACPGDCTNTPLPSNDERLTYSATGCTTGISGPVVCTAVCSSTHEVPTEATPPKVMCSGGRWVPVDAGLCVQKACPALPTVPGVEWTPPDDSLACQLSSPLPVNTQCGGSCASGYQLFDGPLEATCTTLKTWTITGKCEQPCSSPPSSSLFPNTNWNCGNSPFPSRSNCTSTCAIGTGHPDLGATRAQCNNGTWVLAGGSCPGSPPCISAQPALPNVVWNCPASGLPSGGNCSGSCASGSQEVGGALSLTCNSGNWVVGAGRCEPICESPPTGALFSNATWSCGPTASRSQCTGNCTVGAGDPVTGPPTAVCNNGTWAFAGGSCTGCPTRLLPSTDASSTYTWNATCINDPVAGQGTQCFGVCETGFSTTDSNRPRTTCTAGVWQTAVGFCTPITPPANCSDTVLEDLSPAVTWPDNCTASPVVDKGVCVGECSDGYLPAAGASAPRAVCSNGTWQAQLGSCLPRNCTGNPSESLTANTTWNCGDSTQTTMHNGTCTGNCVDDSSGGTTPAPVAKCVLGTWTLVSGSCTGGGKVRYVNMELPTDIVPQFIDKVNSGELLDVINGQMGVYRTLVQSDPSQTGFLNLRADNLFIANGVGGGSRRRSQRRKLTATQTQSITVGYQLNTGGRGLIPAAQEAFVDMVATQPQVISTIDTVVVGSAVERGWVPPTYDFSQIAYAPSDENGTPLRPPAPSVACYMAFDDKNTTGRGILDLPMGGGPEQLQFEAETSPESAELSLCPSVDALVASFPYRATTNIANLSFKAEVMVLTPVTAFRDPSTTCTALAGVGGAAANTALVTCRKTDGSSFVGGAGIVYEILMRATFTCDNRQVEAYTTASFRLREAPKITILRQGSVRPSVCASEKEFRVAFNYTMVGGVDEKQAAGVTAAVTSGDRGIECRVRLVQGATIIQAMRPVSTGTATVTCSGTFKAGSNIDISLILSATPKGCAPSDYTAKASVSVTCCQPGSSYARRQNQGSLKARCWQHFLPGTKATQCQSPTVVHGIYNQGPAAAKLMFFNDQTVRCAARGSVGTAVLECSQKEPRRLSFTIQSSAVNRQARQLFVVQCGQPATASDCPGDVQWRNVRAKPHNASIAVVGTTKTTTFSYDLPTTSRCSCGTAFWSLYEAGTYIGLPKRLCNV